MTTWVKVYNSMPAHPKLVLAGERAAWLFLCGLCYANEHLTDGFIARHALVIAAPGVRKPETLAARLVDAGLWHPMESGWQIHDYTGYQRPAEKIREGRDRDAKRKAVHRESNGSPRGQAAESTPLEVEKRREETSSLRSEVPRKRATRRVDQSKLPDDFPDELVAAVDAVHPILLRCWDARGGIEPGRRGVALSVLRNPRADHQQVAQKLHYWLSSGKGQRQRCADVTARFGDWVEGETSALRVIEGGQERAPALQRMDAWRAGYPDAS